MIKLLSVVDGVHVLDQLQNLVGVADLVKSRQAATLETQKQEAKGFFNFVCLYL